ncbi:Uma2 family endonuclease [Lewinella aquimaris]|uniref:Uma2 family endonuclease n=1 Tax=Neolewinella aquimaris TaxID=1835722 RepID=A0A840EAU1_9BACT|nr:Uma2 family endonuclease [Neolewinella aquimaris]MBB4080832.1 Uma2 family endonuclease [Neolewinella aquimaris]
MTELLTAAETIAQLPTMRWTVDRYHKMVEAGFLDENDRVELLFGKLIDMSPVGIDHRRVVNKIMRLFTQRFPASAYYVDVQNPVTLLDDSEPEPDVYVAIGPADRYKDHHPFPQDLLLVIEVSDSTIRFDRTAKMLVYAMAAIQEYWIVNIYEKQIERFTEPRPAEGNYAKQEIFKAGETFTSLHLGDFAVDDLLVASA